jgi:hypothetical protein
MPQLYSTDLGLQRVGYARHLGQAGGTPTATRLNETTEKKNNFSSILGNVLWNGDFSEVFSEHKKRKSIIFPF